jgi:arylsulfatase A-like enzyme
VRPLLALLAVAAVAVGAILLASGDEDQPRAEAPAGAPNLLVVMTDDQSLASFTEAVMPRTRKLFAEGGTVFEQAIASPPLCCPSRAGFLTGRYAHHHGVVENDVGYGTMTGRDGTLAVALQAGGYRTAMVGKFLNGYEREAGAEPAPGFDRWYSIFGPANYFDFQVSDGGDVRDVAGYATEDLTREAIEITEEADRDDIPFFMWLAYNAPHTVLPGSPPPCDGLAAQPPSPAAFRRFADAPLPAPTSFDERDISDKPSLAGGPGPLRSGQVGELTKAWRCGLAALRAVDEGLGRLISALRESGQLENTVVVYLSDNGLYYGEHRLTDEKRLPLDPALRIPLAVRVGEEVQRTPPPAAVPELVSQVDLAPTLLDFAGVEPWPTDGRSLRPLLTGRGEWPTDRAIPLSLDEGWTYRGLRTPDELYLELDASRWRRFERPAVELYELERDPHQLQNVADRPGEAKRVAALHRRLEALFRAP